VAVAAIKGDRTLVALSEQFKVHPTQSGNGVPSCWSAPRRCSPPREKREGGPDLKTPHAKIGPLALENDSLAGALGSARTF
jgi:hypothetical protein